MNRNVAVLIVVALAVFGVAYMAHRRFDRPIERAGDRGRREVDASEAWRVLMRDGLAALPRSHEILERVLPPDASPRVERLLPSADEPWAKTVRGLLTEPDRRGHETPDRPVMVEPWTRVIPGRPSVHIVRKLPGRVHVRLAARGGGVEPIELDVAIGKRTPLPPGASLRPGMTYDALIFPRKGVSGPVLNRRTIDVLSAAETTAYRRRLELLRRFIADPLVRRYAQGCLAMSGGLHGDAIEVLLHRMKSRPALRRTWGLDARLAYLNHILGAWAGRDRALSRLPVPATAEAPKKGAESRR